ncbi:adenosylmethionine--8-amino-7-oxononanoate transaminase [Sesbania bispinosa]|nr:adenosylmethionine--8-amino-7-oxononanoate transaminase [Sesbania bispinosa]
MHHRKFTMSNSEPPSLTMNGFSHSSVILAAPLCCVAPLCGTVFVVDDVVTHCRKPDLAKRPPPRLAPAMICHHRTMASPPRRLRAVSHCAQSDLWPQVVISALFSVPAHHLPSRSRAAVCLCISPCLTSQ